jgi:hypothetical protein
MQDYEVRAAGRGAPRSRRAVPLIAAFVGAGRREHSGICALLAASPHADKRAGAFVRVAARAAS